MHGFLVIDSTVLGPGKGGIRMTPDFSKEEDFRLARVMTWKCALAECSLIKNFKYYFIQLFKSVVLYGKMGKRSKT